MAQLLIALESGTEPAISGRDNLKTMALVEAAYLSAAQLRSISIEEVMATRGEPVKVVSDKPKGFFGKFFSAPSVSSAPPSLPLETWSNLTPRAQQVLALARKEADRLHHNFIGTEHVLLGLIKLNQGVAVNVITRLGLDLENVRSEVKAQLGTGPDEKPLDNIPYTPRVKKVLALAAKEARELNHTYIGTEHILLGLLREEDGVAGRVLRKFAVNPECTRQ